MVMENALKNKVLLGYGLAVGLLICSILIKELLNFTQQTPLILLLPVIAIATVVGGRGPGLFATTLSAITVNIFFLSPEGYWTNTPSSLYLTAIYFLEGVIVVLILESIKDSRAEAWGEREKFLTTLKSIDDAVIATDTTGYITFINPSASRFTGIVADDAVRKKLGEVFRIYNPDGKRKLLDPVKQVVRSNRPTMQSEESYLISKSGKRYQIDYSISPIHEKDGKLIGAVLIFRDISQRGFLREGMGRMATIVNSSQDAIYSIDLAGRVKTWNQGAEKLFGYSESEILGKNLKQFTVPKGRALEYDQAVRKLSRKEQPKPFETVRITKSGEIKEVLISPSPIFDTKGKVTTISVVTTDITERKKMEQDLFVANRRFELASQAVRGLIYDWDFKADYVYRSPGLLEVTGFRPEEVPAKRDWWMGQIHPEDREKLKWWENLNFKTKGKYTVEYRFLHKNGRYVKLWDHGIIEKDNNGKISRIIGSAIDFSEQEAQEQRKNEFISMASHELKTPLTSLKVFTQLLQNLFSGDQQAHHLLTRMNQQIDSLTGIVNDLLDVSKIESGKLKLRKINFSLDRLIAETVEMIQASNPTHHIVKKGKLSRNIHADRERVNEVLINLLNNAIKYSPNADKVEISLRQQNSHAVVRVKDYGIGIAKKNIPYVFDQFFRVYGSDDKNYPGLGMGLYISSEIVKRHKGKMWVRSKKGDGSTFYFTLPIKNEA